jgi:hypothetical protein
VALGLSLELSATLELVGLGLDLVLELVLELELVFFFLWPQCSLEVEYAGGAAVGATSPAVTVTYALHERHGEGAGGEGGNNKSGAHVDDWLAFVWCGVC